MAEQTIRCAVYTRKSSEEGLEQSFNSLHAQREACEAYILSQKHEGWQLVPTPYDDGGFSGGSMERPGLKALMADVEAKLIDTIVVYKVDRLTRSLADFAKMVEQFDSRSVSFVSVTQAFNTTTSMGRLTLNVLLSFAQFEREVTGERIRDKIAASKAKGMWMGGNIPLGYDVLDRALVVNEAEAEQVRELFRLYLHHQAVDDVVAAAEQAGIRYKQRTSAAGKKGGGTVLGRGSLYKILSSPIYAGEIGHKDKRYPGLHQRIVEADLYDAVQARLERNRRKQRGSTATAAAMLSGLVVNAAGHKLTATHTGKGNKRYRYYAGNKQRVPAGELEKLVTSAMVMKLASSAALASLLPAIELLTPAVIAKAAAAAASLEAADDPGRRAAALEMVDQVVLTPTSFVIDLRLASLGLAGTGSIVVPATIGRANVKLTLIVPGPAQPRIDPSLVAVAAQARRWFAMLAGGSHAAISSIAAADGVTPAYVRQIIDAAFLAPDLVTSIVEGRQPAALTAAKLKTMLPLPAAWSDQRALFARLS
ncbi:recombinase family protein [Sphingomonas sp. Tas61C01]|uniref:recombinase family protein n=1 Tax=Sphingomonas sp. Tas61C01 TaxID=3458297 RepID=UPI00403ED874